MALFPQDATYGPRCQPPRAFLISCFASDDPGQASKIGIEDANLFADIVSTDSRTLAKSWRQQFRTDVFLTRTGPRFRITARAALVRLECAREVHIGDDSHRKFGR